MKILIWDCDFNISNSGGPAGYLYNIKEFLHHSGGECPDKIYFLKDIQSNESGEQLSFIKIKKKIGFTSHLKKYDIWGISAIRTCLTLLRKWRNCYDESVLIGVDLNSFDVIHYHSSQDLYRSNLLLKNFRGIVILTTHSPQPVSFEMTDIIPNSNYLFKLVFRSLFLKYELLAWKRAHYLMFPVKGAVTPYTCYKPFENFYNQNIERFVYCPTSILDKENVMNRDKLIEHLGLNSSFFIVSFIGRHNSIKGYDLLKKYANAILKEFPDVYFLIGGSEGPLQRLKNDRWIELGWIDYGNDLIAASDLFILPNRQTYFDLIALEVLRNGTPIFLSNTGGNTFFREIGSADSDIYFFDIEYFDIDILYNLITFLKTRKKAGKSSNRSLYETYFSMDKYVERYFALLNKLS